MAVQPITLLDIIFDPAQLDANGGYGFLAKVTVGGVDYMWQHALFVAGLGEIDNRVQAAGGGVFSAPLTWDSGTGAADPGTGRVRAGGADLTAATAIHISETDAGGIGIGALLAQMVASTSVMKSQVRLAHRTDRSKWALYLVSAATDNGAWRTLTVTPVASSSASPFADGDPLTWSFVRVGDAGSGAPAATESVAGIAEIATQAEVNARTDSTRIVTADKLAFGTGLTGTSIASASTLTLPAVGDDFAVTGTTTITAISARSPAGSVVRLTFAEVLQLTHNASTLALLTGASIATESGDIGTFRSTATGWAMVGYQRASGRALVAQTVPGAVTEVNMASNSASLDFTAGISAAYDEYVLRLSDIKISNGQSLYLHVRVGGTWQTTGYSYTLGIQSSSARSYLGSNSAAQAILVAGAGQTGNAISGNVELYGLNGTSSPKSHIFAFYSPGTSGDPYRYDGGFSWVGGNGAVTGLRLLASSGNIISGMAVLEGKRRAV